MGPQRAASLQPERRLWRAGLGSVCGLDEVGRGPLAGPVVAAAVVLPPWLASKPGALAHVTDSKKLDARQRFDAYLAILDTALAVAVCRVEAWDIDRENILRASLRAMRAAIARLPLRPDHLLVDGNQPLRCGIDETTIVKGDARSRSIAAASIVAKVTRDAIMRDLDRVCPVYGFARNKGYATPDHMAAIVARGPGPFHRRTFLRFYEEPCLPFDAAAPVEPPAVAAARSLLA